jgi:hypothetical protein
MPPPEPSVSIKKMPHKHSTPSTLLEMPKKSPTGKKLSPKAKGRLPRGLRTPEIVFYTPILRVLVKMGGKGQASEVLSQVGDSTVVFWHFRPKCDTFGVISITGVKT